MHQDDPILNDLNEDQFQAVTHEAGPLLILAGAGSGKTRVITRRIAWLVRDRAVPPWRILAVTFTNKAAGEMRARVHALLSGDAPSYIGTFHAICMRWLRRYADRVGYPTDFVIFDEDDQESLLRRILKTHDPKNSTGAYRSYIDRLKNQGLLEPPDAPKPGDAKMAEVFVQYQRELAAAHAMDFGDLLCLVLKLLREHEDVRQRLASEFLHVLVDEFQDTNPVQYELLKALAGVHRNLCVVGDDDQSIYSWRGARVENILGFREDFPDARVITLRANYRSRIPILRAATSVIARNRKRHPKDLRAERGPGAPVFLHQSFAERDEALFVVREVRRRIAEGVPLPRIAVFYRTHAQSRAFEDVLRSVRIPYRVVGGIKFYQRKEIKDVLAYLRLAVNPSDPVSLARILNIPPRGLGAATLERAREVAAETGQPLLSALESLEVGAAQRARIGAFVRLIRSLASEVPQMDAVAAIQKTLADTGYLDYLKRDESPEGLERVENVEELVTGAREFVATSDQTDLRAYLDRVALMQPADEADADALNLMTVHAAKGLEFDCVFLCGVEEGLLPHGGSLGNSHALEEERRLMYVAMTRARESLYLTWAGSRIRNGMTMRMRPSRFLSEIDTSETKFV